MSNFKFEIIEEIGVVASYGTKEKVLTLVSWNGGKPKYDLRTWDKARSKPGKGITFDDDEIEALSAAIELAI